MKVLFIGPLSFGGTDEMRRQALERLGHHTLPVGYDRFFQLYYGVVRKFQWHLRIGPAVTRFNQMIMDTVRTGAPEMVWVEKGMFVWPSTLEAARESGVKYFVLYSPDNYFLRQNSSRHLWRGLPLYDIVVTTKTHNVAKLKEKGAKQVFLSGNAYDPEIHRPVPLSQDEYKEFGSDVSFIGTWEPAKESCLEAVAQLRVKLCIWGNRWERVTSVAVRNASKGRPAMHDDYAKAICGAKINLCFLSRLAGDAITQRSVEIPACGGLMLAERTDEHLSHFAEDVEAVYFSSMEEMCQKIEYYLGHEEERQRIAAAGRKKCLTAGFSYDERISQILEALKIESVNSNV